MANETIRIHDIEARGTIEFKLVNENFKYNGVLFEHSFDHDKTLFALTDGKCLINGTEVPYVIWTNRLLKFVHYMYPYTFVNTSSVPKLYGGDA